MRPKCPHQSRKRWQTATVFDDIDKRLPFEDAVLTVCPDDGHIRGVAAKLGARCAEPALAMPRRPGFHRRYVCSEPRGYKCVL